MPGSKNLVPPAGALLLRALIVIFLLLPATGSAQMAQPDSREVDRVLADSGLDSGSRALIAGVFEEARTVGIPEELILPKLREGIAKHASPDRIAAAIREDMAFLSSARSVLESLPNGGDLLTADANWDRAANFLKAGFTDETLSGIARASATRAESFRPATLLYVSLVDWGLPGELAQTVVEAAIRSAIEPDAYPEITGLLADAQRSRMDIDDAAREIAQMLDGGRSLRQIARMLRR